MRGNEARECGFDGCGGDEGSVVLIEKEALVAGITTKWRTMTKNSLKPVRENQIRVLR